MSSGGNCKLGLSSPTNYHFVAQSPGDSGDVMPMIKKLHANSARHLNKLDETPGRRVWYQYWDTPLTFEKSYYARLRYVHNNPVKHRLVTRATDYKWCSAAWFKAKGDAVLIKTVESFRIDRLKVMDDFD